MTTNKLRSTEEAEIVLVSGSTHPELARRVASEMGIVLGDVQLDTFPNTEPYVRYEKSIRGKHVFVFQPHAPTPGPNRRSVSDSLQEHLLMINTALGASASEITAVSPVIAGARQDRKTKGREAVSIALTLRQLQLAGAKRVVALDLHSQQSLHAFNGPTDHLTAQDLLTEALNSQVIGENNRTGFVVVAVDEGGAKSSTRLSDALDLDVVFMSKSRDRQDRKKVRHDNIPAVNGLNCLIIDDQIDTAGTIKSAADALNQSGAASISVAATHGFFSEPAVERLLDSPIDKVFITDSVPQQEAVDDLGDRLVVVPLAEKLASAVIEIAIKGSVSRLYPGDQHYQ